VGPCKDRKNYLLVTASAMKSSFSNTKHGLNWRVTVAMLVELTPQALSPAPYAPIADPPTSHLKPRTQAFDNVVELLVNAGRTLPEA